MVSFGAVEYGMVWSSIVWLHGHVYLENHSQPFLHSSSFHAHAPRISLKLLYATDAHLTTTYYDIADNGFPCFTIFWTEVYLSSHDASRLFPQCPMLNLGQTLMVHSVYVLDAYNVKHEIKGCNRNPKCKYLNAISDFRTSSQDAIFQSFSI